MTPAWAQRQAELLSDCIVSPDVFHHLVDRLSDFVVPYHINTLSRPKPASAMSTATWQVSCPIWTARMPSRLRPWSMSSA